MAEVGTGGGSERRMGMRILNRVVSGLLALSVARAGFGDVGGIRERLVAGGKASAELRGKAEAWEGDKRFWMKAVVPEDRGSEVAKRFARRSAVDAYAK